MFVLQSQVWKIYKVNKGFGFVPFARAEVPEFASKLNEVVVQ